MRGRRKRTPSSITWRAARIVGVPISFAASHRDGECGPRYLWCVGHHIHAIIGTAAVVARAADLGLTSTPIALESGFAWVPVPDHEIDHLTETTALPSSPWDERFVHFGSVLPAIVAELSVHGPVAYVETEYFGGVGEQVATAFDDRVRILECGSVNNALRAIGVRAAPGRDEWDTLGLSAHRHMPDA
jgi:hypothetical protein